MKGTIVKIKSEFSGYFKEREDEINGAILAVLSGEHVLFLGPPGTAKTLLAKKICEAVDGGKFYYYLLTRFTTPEEIFGPLSLKALENDEFKRNVDGCLPAAHIALLDEIFKANSSILNSLLTIINERKFHNGNTIVDVPLISVFGASNELPEEDENLEALYDRFLFRYSTEYLQNEDNFDHLVYESSYEFVPSSRIKISDIKGLQEKAKNIKVNDDFRLIIRSLRKGMANEGIHISDRRWKKIIYAMKVAASANGDEYVDKTMLTLLQHMLWTNPQQKEQIRNLVFDLILSGGINGEKLESEVDDLLIAIYNTQDLKLPVTITCENCKIDIEKGPELLKHEHQYPDHKYKLKSTRSFSNSSSDTYDANKLYSYLKINYNYTLEVSLSQEQKKINTKELQALMSAFDEYRKQISKEKVALEKVSLKSTLKNNIWVSYKDTNELLVRHESKYKSIYKLESKLKDISDILDKAPEPKSLKCTSNRPRSPMDMII